MRVIRTVHNTPAIHSSGDKIVNWRLGRIYPTPSHVPKDWSLVRLTSVARLESGHTPSRRRPDYWNGKIPWISLHDSNGLDTQIIRRTSLTVSKSGIENSSARLLPAGTVVLSRTATVGKATIMATEMATSQDFANYVCGDKLHNRYLMYLFRYMGPEWKRLMAGSTHNSIYMPVFQELQILLPPLAEQEAIAEALGDADAWIESLEQLVAKKRHLKQAAMQQLLTGKTRLPGFGEEWETKTIGELFSIGGGVAASRDDLSKNGICYLHYGDIHGTNSTYINVTKSYADIPKLDIPFSKVSRSSVLEDGDIAFVDASEDVDGASRHLVISNPDGIPFISGLHTIVAKPKSDQLTPIYSRYCFQTERVKKQFRFYAVGANVSGISKSNIAKIEICVPGRAEQTAIATAISDMDAEIEAIDAKLAKARQIKQGMMQELLTGRTRLV